MLLTEMGMWLETSDLTTVSHTTRQLQHPGD